MSKKEIKLQRKIKELERALYPFAKFSHTKEGMRPFEDIFVPTEGPVWFYVGKPLEGSRMHMHTDDFKLARRLLQL